MDDNKRAWRRLVAGDDSEVVLGEEAGLEEVTEASRSQPTLSDETVETYNASPTGHVLARRWCIGCDHIRRGTMSPVSPIPARTDEDAGLEEIVAGDGSSRYSSLETSGAEHSYGLQMVHWM